MQEDRDRKVIEILYSDSCGDMVKRRILPKRIYFGMVAGHSREQWILEACDVDTHSADEAFALKDIQAWLPSELQSAPF